MKIAIISSHTHSLFWFRIDMMKMFVDLGHSVIAIGPESEENWKEKFEYHGINYKQINVQRNGTNPFKDINTLSNLYKFMKKERPDKIFTYQAKSIIYGNIAARVSGITEIYSLIAGLGSIFRGSGVKNTVLKHIMKFQFWLACKCSSKVFFQNPDDMEEFVQNGLVSNAKCVIINGSGVNLDKFKPVSLPLTPTFLFIGRLIKDKGIIEFLEACKELKGMFPQVKCLVVGPYDTNPSALTPSELSPYIENKIIEYFGEQEDVREFISKCNVFVLPSYHEGTPKTVLEAMAMGRPIITTNAPGCKQTIIDKSNGFLVEVKDVNDLVEKMKFFIINPEAINKMGQESLEIVKQKYDVRIVNKSIMESMRIS